MDSKTGYSYEVDIWGLGIMIYTMLTGKPPFEGDDVKTIYKKIKLNANSFTEQHISDSARDLLTKILNYEPHKRPTLEEIMTHTFMSNGGQILK